MSPDDVNPDSSHAENSLLAQIQTTDGVVNRNEKICPYQTYGAREYSLCDSGKESDILIASDNDIDGNSIAMVNLRETTACMFENHPIFDAELFRLTKARFGVMSKVCVPLLVLQKMEVL